VGIWDWLKGNPEKKYREKFPESKKPSEEQNQEPEEQSTTPAFEETDEKTFEPQTEESEEATQESATEKPEEQPSVPTPEDIKGVPPEASVDEIAEQTPEAISEAQEEPTSKLEVDEAEKLAPESSSEESEEPLPEPPAEELEQTPEPVTEEAGELTPEPPAHEKEKPLPKRRRLRFGKFRGFGVSSKKRKEKPKKKEKESTPEPEFFKFLILPITLVSMLLGLSIMPLFPQPLPAILAFLIAFLTYKKPILGMPIGGLAIGLGLMYNLSTMNFISTMGSSEIRGVFVFGFLFLFTALPIIFRSRKAVLSINLGIIAAISLFFGQAYFLAIPLIFTAIVLFKRISFLSVIYYAMISVPLQILQYLNLVLPIERWDWWVVPGTSPPIYVPLTEIFTEVQESMLQFRLYDTSKVVYAITDQITLDPPVMTHTVQEMISHYIDSLPGIAMFLFMVIGVVSAFVFLARMFFARTNISNAERLVPMLSATVGVALFFILASSLQGALAFRVDVNGVQMALATFATLLFTVPTFLMDYTPKERASADMMREKAKELQTKLQLSEDELAEVKSSLPISYGAFEVKMQMIRDNLNDIIRKTSMRLEDAKEIDKIFSDLDSLSIDIDNLMLELDSAVGEYQIFVNCEYSKWLGMFKDIGLEPPMTAKAAPDQAAPLNVRIDQVNEVLDAGRTLANEIIKVAEQAYDVIRSFYDPSLPEENQSITFAKKKLDEKATPWIALDALYSAITNWSKQYKVQISKSVDYLHRSLAIIAEIRNYNGRLLHVLGDDFPKMMENVQKAENIKLDIEKRALNAFNVIAIKDVFESSLSIGRDVLLILYEKLKNKEKAVDLLSPSEDFLWEKNDALIKRMDAAMKVTSKLSNIKLSEVLESLPKFLSYVDECVETIALYNEMEEILLNYPVAEITVENLFREKKSVSAKDLPFESKYAEEYLKLFYSQKFREFSLDRTNMLLTKKK
jgi:chemotaxis protein histidine kinase CheA